MSLPANWVDSLFARLAIRYGREWVSKWEGVDIAGVKDDWAEELSGFQQHPDAIRYGLAHLPPDRPPNVQQFRDLCRRAPAPAVPRLMEPDAKPEVVAQAVSQLAAVAKRVATPVDREWARNLKARIDAGFKVPLAHREMVNEALKENP